MLVSQLLAVVFVVVVDVAFDVDVALVCMCVLPSLLRLL